jgi:nitrogen fixation NifU-like protein
MEDEKFYELIDVYRNPPNKGKLEDFDVSEEGYSSTCSDRFTVYIKFDGNKIKKSSFDGVGCVISTISASRLCDALVGKTAEEAQSMTIEDIKKLIGVDQISISRTKCATIALETVKNALSKDHMKA